MKCPSCGKDNPAGEQYCLDCGSDLAASPATPAGRPAAAVVAAPAAPAAPAGGSLAMSDEEFQRLLSTPPAPTACPHCGAAAPAGGTFCDNCGEPLKAETPAAGTAAPVEPAAQPASVNPHAAPAAGAAAQAAPAPASDPSTKPTVAIPEPASGSTITFDVSGPTAKSVVAMQSVEVKIGRRDADAGIYPEIDFDGNDIVIDSGERVHAVSRRHGRIFREGDQLKFEDLGSTNGSTVNGAAVLAHDPLAIKDGDAIVLGRTCRITVHLG